MIALSLKEIAELLGATLHSVPDPEVKVSSFVEFDSRKITPGGLFLAIPGSRVDGHDFAQTAIDAGAVAVLSARPVGVPAIVIDPAGRPAAEAVVGALSTLARAVIDRLKVTVVGVTGSAGKTSTKDLIATVLSAAGPTVAPPGSFNNELGHPYTVLRCDEDTDFLVAEMSARGIGHIAHLAAIAPPRIGVVLNVGSAHLGEFGSRENIAQAKGELVEALPSAMDGGVAILNADDPYVAAMAARTSARVLRYSTQRTDVDVYASEITLDDVARASFTLNVAGDTARVSLKVFGEHQVGNALAAVCVGLSVGMGVEEIVDKLGKHRNASAHRMDVQTRADGVTVINDSYNANPDSMRAGIAALAYTASGRDKARSIAVLGEMSELGANALEEHREIGAILQRYRVSHLVAVGTSPLITALSEQAQQLGVHTRQAQNAEEAGAIVEDILHNRPAEYNGHANPGDVVLVKASNSQGLWAVAQRLLAAEQSE